MQSTADPYPAGTESLATNGEGELERLRYQFKTQFGLSQWYHDATTPYETLLTNIGAYRRPTLVWISATTIDVEENTGTDNQTKILFPDGTSRSVTENTASTHVNRRFLITATASLSGTKDSGLRSSLSEATDTWYAIYAVKVTDNSTDFVLVGDTTLPLQANFATLNTNFGTNGWVYLGLIRNGDNSAATGDILRFLQVGNVTSFFHEATGNAENGVGIRLATSAGATSVTYTYSAGTGTTDIPAIVKLVEWQSSVVGAAGETNSIRQASGARPYYWLHDSATATGYIYRVCNREAALGCQSAGGNRARDIYLSSFIDNILGPGSNPQL